jgi:16S rRNA (cytosine1407-C5)-methyltransferase
MFPPVALAPQPSWELLDLAAAPGSKTLQLACLTGAPERIAAVEMVRDRFFRLKRNLRAQGAAAVRTYQQDGTRVWRYRPDHFDAVLLDAPCSTEGRFRADEEETFRYWSPSKIKAMARKQRQLLRSAVRCAQPGGVIVYATCSFAPEENEAVIDDVLRAYPGAVEVDPIGAGPPGMLEGMGVWDGDTYDAQVRGARRLPPDGTYEAFFVCRLIKTGPTGDPVR